MCSRKPLSRKSVIDLQTMRLLPHSLPSLSNDRYDCRLAKTQEEICRAQHLRFEVFNLELGEGLASSYLHQRDQDPFDAVCDHMILIDRMSGEVVGTYRMQSGDTAEEAFGYVSEQAFDFSPFERVRSASLELGRACLHPDHRHYQALSLLWKGILRYANKRALRYLLGCSSLHGLDIQQGHAIYEALKKSHLAPEAFQTTPHFETQLPFMDWESVTPRIPKLLRCYLSLGAKICGRPSMDESFGTIDFLTLLDLKDLSLNIQQRFLGTEIVHGNAIASKLG